MKHSILLPAIALALGVAPLVTSAADVHYYSVNKGILFTQAPGGAPQLKTGFPYHFQAAVVAASNTLGSNFFQWPGNGRILQQRLAAGPFTYTDRHATPELINLFYPNGAFTFTLHTSNDGPRTVTLNMVEDLNPNPPSIVGLGPAQSINPSNDYTLRWSGFIGGTTNDFVFVRVDAPSGVVFRSAYAPGLPDALSGTNTSLLIPAGTLPAGRALSARVIFFKVIATNVTDYPGATGAVTWYTQTEFFLATTGAGDVTPPGVNHSLPASGATNVPLNAPFGVTFNEPMSGGFSVFINGTIAGRTFAWSPDVMTFLTTPTTAWPQNTTIGWVFNPSDATPTFSDTRGNPLAPETTFIYTTGTNTAPPAAPVLAQPVRQVNGRFQFKLLGETNRIYAAQASADFTNWVSLGTNIAYNGVMQFLDTNAPSIPRRFYRGVAP